MCQRCRGKLIETIQLIREVLRQIQTELKRQRLRTISPRSVIGCASPCRRLHFDDSSRRPRGQLRHWRSSGGARARRDAAKNWCPAAAGRGTYGSSVRRSAATCNRTSEFWWFPSLASRSAAREPRNRYVRKISGSLQAVTFIVTVAAKSSPKITVESELKASRICLVRMRGLEPPLPCEN